MSGLETVLLGTAVALGALCQRATGLGLALVAAPFLVLVAGPVAGVSLSNTLSASLCALVLARTWRRALWRQVALLGLSALIGIPLGVVVVRTLPDGPLLVAIGTLSIAAVLVAALAGGRDLLPGRRSAVLAGALGGFMNATAGVGGPMVSAYGVSRRWGLPEFIPTVQGTLLVVNLASLAGKGLPSLDPAVWLVCAAALVTGLLAGELVGGRLGGGPWAADRHRGGPGRRCRGGGARRRGARWLTAAP